MLGQKKPSEIIFGSWCEFGKKLMNGARDLQKSSQFGAISLGLSAHVSCMSPLHKSLFLRHPNISSFEGFLGGIEV